MVAARPTRPARVITRNVIPREGGAHVAGNDTAPNVVGVAGFVVGGFFMLKGAVMTGAIVMGAALLTGALMQRGQV